MLKMAELPRDRTLISTRDAAEILGMSQTRIRQLASIPPEEGGLWAHRLNARMMFLDKAEVLKRSRAKQKTGRPASGFRPG